MFRLWSRGFCTSILFSMLDWNITDTCVCWLWNSFRFSKLCHEWVLSVIFKSDCSRLFEGRHVVFNYYSSVVHYDCFIVNNRWKCCTDYSNDAHRHMLNKVTVMAASLLISSTIFTASISSQSLFTFTSLLQACMALWTLGLPSVCHCYDSCSSISLKV